jgi:hypothetical protein
VINSTDYFLYLPLMPQVAGGFVEPRHICVSLPRRLRKARFVLRTVDHWAWGCPSPTGGSASPSTPPWRSCGSFPTGASNAP